jgi:predicted nuclease of predicted toxin-antitoxin system
LPVSLYADECVDMRIVAGLRRRNVDVLSAVEAGFAGESDEQHIERALQVGRVVLTADHDFLRIANARAMTGGRSPGVVFILPRTAVGAAIRAILLIVASSPEHLANQIHWVP